MKKIALFMTIIILTLVMTSCGAEKNTSPEDTTDEIRESNLKNESKDDEDDLYDSIENYLNLKMKMYGNYYCTKNAKYHYFFDGEVVVTFYSKGEDNNFSSIPLNFSEFSLSYPLLFESRISVIAESYNLSFSGSKTINGFNVKEFNGTIKDYDENIHNCKAYTFVVKNRDCVVVAAPIKNSDEMIEKMNKDIDIFMNNLKLGD